MLLIRRDIMRVLIVRMYFQGSNHEKLSLDTSLQRQPLTVSCMAVSFLKKRGCRRASKKKARSSFRKQIALKKSAKNF